MPLDRRLATFLAAMLLAASPTALAACGEDDGGEPSQPSNSATDPSQQGEDSGGATSGDDRDAQGEAP